MKKFFQQLDLGTGKLHYQDSAQDISELSYMQLVSDEYSVQAVILALLLVLPLIAIFHLAIAKEGSSRTVSIWHSAFAFIFSSYLAFDSSPVLLDQFSVSPYFSDSFYLAYGSDPFSSMLLMLTCMLTFLCVLSSWNSITYRFKEFAILLFVIQFLLMNAFSALNVLVFFVAFESTLIPLYLMIGIWGPRQRKIYAGYKFFLFTFAGSFAMFVSILYMGITVGSLDYRTLLNYSFSDTEQLFLFSAFFLSFAVKTPIVPFHSWLPEAHVEAPTAGSVLLAGILLKLGGFGVVRYCLPLFPHAVLFFRSPIFWICLVSIIYSSFLALRQSDMKKTIAYSSIAHMNLGMMALFSGNVLGTTGAIYLMYSHGIVSGGLFLCVGVIYDRYGTKLIETFGGLSSLMPALSWVFLCLSMANIGLPGTISFIGEYSSMASMFRTNTFVTLITTFVILVVGAAYTLWLCNRIFYGQITGMMLKASDLNRRESFYLYFNLLFVVAYGVFPIFNLHNVRAEYLPFIQVPDCLYDPIEGWFDTKAELAYATTYAANHNGDLTKLREWVDNNYFDENHQHLKKEPIFWIITAYWTDVIWEHVNGRLHMGVVDHNRTFLFWLEHIVGWDRVLEESAKAIPYSSDPEAHRITIPKSFQGLEEDQKETLREIYRRFQEMNEYPAPKHVVRRMTPEEFFSDNFK